jgi:hypothetical protein
MIVGVHIESSDLDLDIIVSFLHDDLPPVVFSDDSMTKMHDSLAMILFRFEILLKLYEAEQFAWVAYFFPWVLLNEAMSHKNVRSIDRLGRVRLENCYLMKCNETYRSASL